VGVFTVAFSERIRGGLRRWAIQIDVYFTLLSLLYSHPSTALKHQSYFVIGVGLQPAAPYGAPLVLYTACGPRNIDLYCVLAAAIRCVGYRVNVTVSPAHTHAVSMQLTWQRMDTIYATADEILRSLSHRSHGFVIRQEAQLSRRDRATLFVSRNLVTGCSDISEITLERACSRWMALNVSHDYPERDYSIGHISLFISLQ